MGQTAMTRICLAALALMLCGNAAAQAQQAGQAAYANARQACLEGRGYSVK
jgi:hypothetical protein